MYYNIIPNIWGVPLGNVGGGGGAPLADPGDHGQADVGLKWKMLQGSAKRLRPGWENDAGKLRQKW